MRRRRTSLDSPAARAPRPSYPRSSAISRNPTRVPPGNRPMSRTVFVNGAFVPFEEACVPIMERGFLFADGIYEVSAAVNGRLVDNEAHLARLDRSLGEIRIANPYSAAEWTRLEEELVARNDLKEGLVYMEVTRGVAERDFAFPPPGVPTVVMFTQPKTIRNSPQAETG